ncbi:MAG: hypothetical protein AB8I08_07265 [Sandaracinaceae bacterium]
MTHLSPNESSAAWRGRGVGRAAFVTVGCAALIAAGCAAGTPSRTASSNDTSGDEHAQHAEPALELDLSAESEVMFGDREQSVHVVIVNRSEEEVSAEEIAPELRIDGRPAMQLDLAAQGFSRLAPGQTAEFDQPLGVRLLTPGRHTLSLDRGDTHSLPLHIVVRD